MALYISLFLIVVAIATYLINPKSKQQVWIYSILTIVIFAIVLIFFLAAISKSTLSLSYRLGTAMGACIIPLVISIPTLYISLKKKLDKTEKYKYPIGLFVGIIVFGIIGGISLWGNYTREKTLEKYLELESSKFQKNNNNEEANSTSPDNINKGLPESMGNGMTMQKYEVDKYKAIFTVKWDGKSTGDFSDSYIDSIRDSFIKQIKNSQFSSNIQTILERAKENGFDMVFVFKNESNEELFTFTILPYEL